MTDTRADLRVATERYLETEAAFEAARADTVNAVVDALRDGVGPTEVTDLSPFTAAYVRRLARENGIPPARPGIKAKPTADQ